MQHKDNLISFIFFHFYLPYNLPYFYKKRHWSFSYCTFCSIRILLLHACFQFGCIFIVAFFQPNTCQFNSKVPVHQNHGLTKFSCDELNVSTLISSLQNVEPQNHELKPYYGHLAAADLVKQRSACRKHKQ